MKSVLLAFLFAAVIPGASTPPAITTHPIMQPDSIYGLAINPADYPDESYVWLLDEGVYKVQADGRTSRTTRQVVQILKQEAAEAYRERQLSWNPDHDKLTVNWMRVVKPNGEVIADHPEQVQDSDIPAEISTPTYSSTKVRRLSLSGLEVGTILDFSVTTESDAPMMPGEFMFPWIVTTPVPVMRSNLVVEVPAAMNPRITENNLYFKRRETVANGRKTYTWATDKVPKLKIEPFVPDSIVQGTRITVSPPLGWTAIGEWYAPIATKAYTISPVVEEKMAKVMSGAKSRSDSINALHDWVASDIRYVAIELGQGGYVPRSAETVVRTGFGDCKDKAMLFLAALKKIGVTGYPVLLNAFALTPRSSPSLSQFNHMIAAIQTPNGYEYTDLTAGNYPVGALPSSEQGGLAIVVKEKSAEQVTLPKLLSAATSVDTWIKGSLGNDGNFSGTVETLWKGDFAPEIRSAFRTPLDSTKRQSLGRALAGEYLENPEVDSLVAFDGKDFHTPARITTKVIKAKMLSKAGDVSLLMNPVRPSDSWLRLAEMIDKQKDRKLPYATKAFIPLATDHIDVRIKLPAGWTVSVPLDVKEDGPLGHFALTYSQVGNELHIERSMTGADTTIPVSRQSEITAWMRKIGADDGKFLVIKAPPHSVASR